MLNPTQLIALSADIVVKSAIGQPLEGYDPTNVDHAFAIRDYYNTATSPEVIVWRSSVTRQEILQNGFDWTRLDNLRIGKARVWNDMFVEGVLNPSRPNIRSGIEEVWKGTPADLAVREAVYVRCKRAASNAEALFAVGTGTTVSPSTMTFDGALTYQDVLNSNNV